MKNYNPYFDCKNYTGTYNIRTENIPSVAAFAYRPGELCFYADDEKSNNCGVVIHNFETNNISPLDKTVMSLIASCGFITTKQIGEALTLLDVAYSDSRLKSSLDRLKRNSLVRSMCFGENKNNLCSTNVYSINKFGSEAVKVLGINHTFSPMSPASYAYDVKRVLAQNQIMLAFLKSGLNIEWFRRGDVITSRCESGETAIVRPSFTVSVDGEVLMYEAVRSGDFWEGFLKDKLSRYKLLLNNFGGNSWKLETVPTLVICGESFEHNKRISELTAETGINVLFTEDLLLCGINFFKSHYSIANDGNKEIFGFSA